MAQAGEISPQHFTATADPATGGLLKRTRWVNADGAIVAPGTEGATEQSYYSVGPVASTHVEVTGADVQIPVEDEGISAEDAQALDGIMQRSFARVAQAKNLSLPQAPSQG